MAKAKSKGKPKIPQPDISPSVDRIQKPDVPEDNQLWSFSFRFFREDQEFFGIGGADAQWLASLIERLAHFPKEPIKNVWTNHAMRTSSKGLHIHDINWQWTNVPMQREDFSWLADVYLSHPAEYPILQFHIETTLGRVIGFFDEKWVFNILLLDQLHNMQPSGVNEYRCRPTERAHTHHAIMLSRIDEAKRLQCGDASCPFPTALKDMTSYHLYDHLVYLRLDDSEVVELDKVMKAKGCTSAKDLLLDRII